MKPFSIILCCTLIFVGSACKKTSPLKPGPDPNPDPRLVLGYALDGPPFTSTMYLVNKNGLFEDTNARSITNFSFTSAALDTAKYHLAYPLLSEFPQYLRNDTGGNLVNVGPIGMGVLHLEYTENGHTVKWNIPPDTTVLPAQIRSYVYQVNAVFYKL